MCGHFAQSQPREEYLAYRAEEAERDIVYEPEPIGQYNMKPVIPDYGGLILWVRVKEQILLTDSCTEYWGQVTEIKAS